jgi:mycothiol synthase
VPLSAAMAGTKDLSRYSFVALDPSKDTDEDIARSLEMGNRLQAEVLPDDPPTPLEDAIASHRSVPARMRRFTFRVFAEDGAVVAGCGARFDPDHDDNPDIMGLNINVLPEHRGQGIATRLVADMVALAQAEGRTRFFCSTNERMPSGAAFCESLGAEPKQTMHMNHLPLDELDRAETERWVAEAATRSAGYELLLWDGDIPEEHVDQYLDLVLVMNTAPRDDLEVNDFTLTKKELREGEEQMHAVGMQQLTVVARRVSDGAFAGFHDVARMPSEPMNAYVRSTGVVPEHRGFALGKWLKAEMTLRILRDWPEVTHIRTGNADSNDAMLGINKKMGYRPLIGTTTWELPVERAAAWVAERSAT